MKMTKFYISTKIYSVQNKNTFLFGWLVGFYINSRMADETTVILENNKRIPAIKLGLCSLVDVAL